MTGTASSTTLPGASQLGLFDGDTVAIDTAFATAHRITLDQTSWIEHVPGWFSGSETLFAQLLEGPDWQQRERWMINQMVIEPRLTAEYPEIADAPSLLQTIGAALSAHYGIPYDGLWLNLYRDHRDGTGWHGDWPSCKRDECIVPVLSLGSPRRFLIRPRDGGRSVALTPLAGDLVVMGGRCQRDWRHCVPKQTSHTGARISVNFKSSLQAQPLR